MLRRLKKAHEKIQKINFLVQFTNFKLQVEKNYNLKISVCPLMGSHFDNLWHIWSQSTLKKEMNEGEREKKLE